VSLTNVTSIVVSHDSSFLDFICTHIIHYENRKLRIYRGNLTEFVRQKPEARSYYEVRVHSHRLCINMCFVLVKPRMMCVLLHGMFLAQ